MNSFSQFIAEDVKLAARPSQHVAAPLHAIQKLPAVAKLLAELHDLIVPAMVTTHAWQYSPHSLLPWDVAITCILAAESTLN